MGRVGAWHERWTTIVGRIRIIRSPLDEAALLGELAMVDRDRVLGFVNAQAMNVLAEDSTFHDRLASADVLLRDGSGMALLYRRQSAAAGMNMNGTDFIPKVLAEFRGRRVALWGTREPFIGNSARRCESDFGVQVISVENGFRDPGHYVDLATKAQPELIVLGMGMPKQEYVASLIRSRAAGTALIVCGGAILDFLGGRVTRAPRWMRRSGIEWVYRLVLEPRRLFFRYVIGNPVFLIRVVGWHPARKDPLRWAR